MASQSGECHTTISPVEQAVLNFGPTKKSGAKAEFGLLVRAGTCKVMEQTIVETVDA